MVEVDVGVLWVAKVMKYVFSFFIFVHNGDGSNGVWNILVVLVLVVLNGESGRGKCSGGSGGGRKTSEEVRRRGCGQVTLKGFWPRGLPLVPSHPGGEAEAEKNSCYVPFKETKPPKTSQLE